RPIRRVVERSKADGHRRLRQPGRDSSISKERNTGSKPVDPPAGDGSPKVLYLSYDGMTDPLGQAQVVPYLAGLAARGYQISLVSCEKPERFADGEPATRRALSNAGIHWHPIPYTKRPPVASTVWDLAMLHRAARAL